MQAGGRRSEEERVGAGAGCASRNSQWSTGAASAVENAACVTAGHAREAGAFCSRLLSIAT